MSEEKRYETLRKYMEEEFGVTPENIDLKLKELKESLNNKSGQAKS